MSSGIWCLYVTDRSPKCVRAIENLRRACEEHLAGRYTIEIVGLPRDPGRAADDQILAVPTVVRRLPAPIRKLVGDLSDSERLLVGLELRQSGSQREGPIARQMLGGPWPSMSMARPRAPSMPSRPWRRVLRRRAREPGDPRRSGGHRRAPAVRAGPRATRSWRCRR